MLKKSEWIFAWNLYVKSKTKTNVIFQQNYIALVYANIVKCLWNIYRIYLKAHSQIWDNFWQLKALQKWWKMLFISRQKLFSF